MDVGSHFETSDSESGPTLELLNAVNLQLQITAVITLASSVAPLPAGYLKHAFFFVRN